MDVGWYIEWDDDDDVNSPTGNNTFSESYVDECGGEYCWFNGLIVVVSISSLINVDDGSVVDM